jgi:hypothetical protein
LTDCNGYWKINNSILNEEEYKQIINNLINSYLNTKKTIDIRLLWDTLKIEIREITQFIVGIKLNRPGKILEIWKKI